MKAGRRFGTPLEPGPTAPHSVKPFPGLDVEPLIGAGWRKGDDYLNVNIWAPDAPESGDRFGR